MSAHDHFEAGRLADAITAMTAEVKANPTDVARRSRLFAYLCFAGELERADRQLDALGAQDEALERGSRVYRNLLASESHRRRIVEGKEAPFLPPDAPLHATKRRDALLAFQSGDAAGGSRLLDEAAEVSPALPGVADARAFSSIRDADDVLGSVLEVYAGGRSLWLPWERVRSLTLAAPRQLLDLLWAPAELEDADGSQAAVHVPVLYAGSHAFAAEAVRVGKSTEWVATQGVTRAQGQRILDAAFADDAEDAGSEIAVLSLRSLSVSAASPGSD